MEVNILSDSERAEALVESLEAHIRPVTYPSGLEVIENVDEALRAYFITPTSETNYPTPTRFKMPSGI
jgi:hypothetical protein